MDAINEFLTNSNIVEILTTGAINLLIAIVIFVVGKWIANRVQKTLESLLRKRNVDDVLVDFLGTIASTLIIIVAVIAAVDQMGIPATSFMAVIGAAGLAIGLALKDSLSNFASGVMLLIFRPFKIGDYVEVAGTAGSVQEIGVFSTVLNTPDNRDRALSLFGFASALRRSNLAALDYRVPSEIALFQGLWLRLRGAWRDD